MTDVSKIEVPRPQGGSTTQTIDKLVEAVNQLQGVNGDQQRAVRVFEFESRIAAVEARLKKAGL